MRLSLRSQQMTFVMTLVMTMGCAPSEPQVTEASSPASAYPQPADSEPSAAVAAEHPMSQPLTDLMVGDSGQTPQASLHALMDAGMAAYAEGQQRAFEQWAGIAPQPLPDQQQTPETPVVPDSLQQMADQLVLQYKESIGVDPNTRVTKPQLPTAPAQ